MDQRVFWLAVVAVALPVGVSAQSIHRFYKEEDVVFRPELLGRWEVEGAAFVEFKDLGDKSYGVILHADKDSAIYFRAHLFCLDERCFLDGQVAGLKPGPATSDDEDSPFASTTKPNEQFDLKKEDILGNRAHGLLLISFGKDDKDVSLSIWSDSWLPKMAELGKLPVAHTRDDLGRVLLTAETDDLRNWVKDLPEEAFDNPEKLVPVKGVSEAGLEPATAACKERIVPRCRFAPACKSLETEC